MSVLALNSRFVLASATPPFWGESARAQALEAAITSTEDGSRQKAAWPEPRDWSPHHMDGAMLYLETASLAFLRLSNSFP